MRHLLRLLVPVCLGGVGIASAAGVLPTISKARDTLRSLPIRFEANTGQWDPQVRFAARAAGYSLALTDREAVLSVGPRRVTMSLAGANPKPQVLGSDPLPARGNFFLGKATAGWRTGVPIYNRVRYQDVYPGIDLVYYGNGTQLEYDFVLQPGADPSQIRIRFGGAGRVSLTAEGDLTLDSAGARLLQKRPLVYQQDATGEKRQVAARYRMLDKHTAAVDVAAYDHSRPLVIDPVLYYSSLFGGVAADGITCVKVDSQGFIWAAGYISDGATDVRGNFYSNVYSGGNTDVFILRIDPTQTGIDSLAYFTYIGGQGNDVANDIAIDSANNVYVTGYTTSDNFPMAGPSYQTTLNSSTQDTFVVKLRTDIAGADALVWSTYLGGSGVDDARGIAVDRTGKVYIAGITKSTDFPVTSASAYQATLWGAQDAFIARFDPDAGAGSGSLLYSTLLGGEGYDDAGAIAIAPDGSVYVGGSTTSSQFPWNGGAYQSYLNAGTDAWIARVNADAAGPDSIPYASYFGGSGSDELRGMSVDASNRLWITGVTLSPDFPVTDKAYQSGQPGGGGDVFVTCLDFSPDRAAFIAYSSYLGGTGGEVAYGVAPGAGTLVWITGYTLSADFPVTRDAAIHDYPGATNIFVTAIDTAKSGDAALAYSTYFGQINQQVGLAIGAGSGGMVAIVGRTGNNGVQGTDNAARSSYAGGLSDGFVSIFK